MGLCLEFAAAMYVVTMRLNVLVREAPIKLQTQPDAFGSELVWN